MTSVRRTWVMDVLLPEDQHQFYPICELFCSERKDGSIKSKPMTMDQL